VGEGSNFFGKWFCCLRLQVARQKPQKH